MAEPKGIVTVTAGATGSRERLTGDKLKVYNTSYGASYGEGANETSRVNFTSNLRHPTGTGFTANQRPAIYYRPSLDLTDNPHFGFMSQTKRHYHHHGHSDCRGSLPNLVNKPRDSGFCYLRSHPKTVGGAEKVQVESQQTLSSVMKNDFLPPSFLQGTEVIPGPRSRSCRETGFTRGAISPLAFPSSLLPSPQTKSKAPTKKAIGRKGPSGYLLNESNNQTFPHASFNFSPFTTHYMSKFCQDTDLEKLRSGQTAAGIISAKMDNGYNRRDTDKFIFRG